MNRREQILRLAALMKNTMPGAQVYLHWHCTTCHKNALLETLLVRVEEPVRCDECGAEYDGDEYSMVVASPMKPEPTPVADGFEFSTN